MAVRNLHTINRRKLLLIPILLAVVVLAGIVGALLLLRGRTPRQTPVQATILPPPSPPPQPTLVERRIVVRQNDKMAKILERFGLTPRQVEEFVNQVRPVYDLKKIKAGAEMRFLLTPEAEVAGLDYPVDDVRYLEVRREDGLVKAGLKNIPYVVETAVLCGATEGNLRVSFIKLGEREILAQAFAAVFEWDVDFNTDQRPGDAFRVVYEKKFLEGKFVAYGEILAAEFTNRENNQGKPIQAFLFSYQHPESKKTISGYFDLEGKSLKKEFIRSPFKYEPRITSRYSSRRLNPISKVVQPHYGVDFGAPLGAPVQATADGTVTFAGLNGGAGKMITLRHRNGYETLYLHLSGWPREIGAGKRVSAGDVIGYVGNTGESTGPHLDYRMKKNGIYFNPLSYKPDPGEPIPSQFMPDFLKAKTQAQARFELPFFILNCFRFF